jgi:hypothetical protein
LKLGKLSGIGGSQQKVFEHFGFGGNGVDLNTGRKAKGRDGRVNELLLGNWCKKGKEAANSTNRTAVGSHLNGVQGLMGRGNGRKWRRRR